MIEAYILLLIGIDAVFGWFAKRAFDVPEGCWVPDKWVGWGYRISAGRGRVGTWFFFRLPIRQMLIDYRDRKPRWHWLTIGREHTTCVPARARWFVDYWARPEV